MEYTIPQFVRHVGNPEVIVECGARDCQDSVDMLEAYRPRVVYAFECNPFMLPTCRAACVPGVVLVEKAAWHYDGELAFGAVEAVGSAGGASVFTWTAPGAAPQTRVTVPCVRLDTFMCGEEIDMLCMDVQGAELSVLRGLGELRPRVIITEVMIRRYYSDAPAGECLLAWFSENGYKRAAWSGSPDDFYNALFVR